MRALIGCPTEDGQTGIYLNEALFELGHIAIANINGRNDQNIMLDMVDEYHPDFVLITKDSAYAPIIEELIKKVFVVMWNFDPRPEIQMHSNALKLFLNCHLVFTNEANKIEDYKKIGVKNIHWLSEGIAPNWHRKEKLYFKDHIMYDSDTAFAGSTSGIPHIYENRNKFINKLKNDISSFKTYTDVFNRDHNRMVQCTKINLGYSAYPGVSLSMSARDYRIMGAGGFLLTNYVNEMETWFEIGKMCDVYRTYDECVDKIRYYIEHENERKIIADYGYKIVHEKHKFSDRLKEIIKKVKELV
jgi:hypothetical protein